MDHLAARRLLIAKAFFREGVEKSGLAGPMNHIAAVHHLHIAVEITLRAVLLTHQVRTEKTLNIDFESLLNEVDRFGQDAGKGKLINRQEMRSLNSIRNLAQHHAIEPQQSALQDMRAFTHQFLRHCMKSFFDADFELLSRRDLIDDRVLAGLLAKGAAVGAAGDYNTAYCLVGLTFKLASYCLKEAMPDEESTSFFTSDLSGDVERAVIRLLDRISETEHFVILLSSGITMVEWRRYESLAPSVSLTMSGRPYLSFRHSISTTPDDLAWAIEFVVDAILAWQDAGLSPTIPSFAATETQRVLSDGFRSNNE